MEAKRRTLGEEHLETLRSMHTLAISYSEAGRRQEALELMERVVKAMKRTLGEEHSDTLRSIRTLKYLRTKFGEYAATASRR